MSAADVVAAALLGLAVLGVVAAVVGALRAGGPLDAVHFGSAASIVPPALLAMAVLVERGLDGSAVLAVLACAAVIGTSAPLSTALARAIDTAEGSEDSGTGP